MDYISSKWALINWAVEQEPKTVEHLENVKASYLRTIELVEKRADKKELRDMMLWFAWKEDEINESLKALRTILETNKDVLIDNLITDEILLSRDRQLKLFRELKEECRKRLI
jgi:hypothetical protein